MKTVMKAWHIKVRRLNNANEGILEGKQENGVRTNSEQHVSRREQTGRAGAVNGNTGA